MSQYIDINSQGVEVSQNIPNAETDIIAYDVPRRVARRIKRNPPIQLLVPVKDTFDGDGSTTTFNLTKNVVDVPKKSKDTIAVVGGTEETGYSIDYSNDTITFDSAPASGTENVEVYYIPAEGNTFRMKVYDNDERERNDTVFKALDKSLFTQDQFDNSQAKRLSREVRVVEDMELVVQTNSSFQYSVDDIAVDRLLVLELPYASDNFSQMKKAGQIQETRKSLGEV